MSEKTWDVLDRETGDVISPGLSAGPSEWPSGAALRSYEVAYCRETGEVVYR